MKTKFEVENAVRNALTNIYFEQYQFWLLDSSLHILSGIQVIKSSNLCLVWTFIAVIVSMLATILSSYMDSSPHTRN